MLSCSGQFACVRCDAVLQRTIRHRQRNRHLDVFAPDAHLAHHAQIHDIAPQFGIHHIAQRFHYLLFRYHFIASSKRIANHEGNKGLGAGVPAPNPPTPHIFFNYG